MRRLSWILAVLMLFAAVFTGCGTASAPEYLRMETDDMVSAKWQMGFGDAIISIDGLEGPFYIAGYDSGREITGTYDEMRASAVWMDVGGEGILLIGVDCVGLGRDWVEKIRTALSPFCLETGCASVNVYSTHSHAGIDTLGLWGEIAKDGKNPAFMERLVEACVTAANLAHADRKPGTLTYGYTRTDMQYDSRIPEVFDENLYQLRFIPDDGSAGIRMFSYAAHAESLRGANTMLSRDFPGVMSDLLLEETGERMLYMPSAIGGLIMTRQINKNAPGSSVFDEQYALETTGERMLTYALEITDERVVEPVLEIARTEFEIPMHNTVYLYYRFLGILGNETRESTDSGTGYNLVTELSVLKLGDIHIAMIPGEIFPELVTGEYMDETSARPAANPTAENPVSLLDIAAEYGIENLLILGLANDEIGYIIPPNDFIVHPETPYLTNAGDIDGENHYEETNSVGIDAAGCISDAFRALLGAMYE
ncbi:MAG: hypothetical protein IJY35_05130 [Clostridia bacterium]|nr:hypothetical protein [Clostridia bacterium]